MNMLPFAGRRLVSSTSVRRALPVQARFFSPSVARLDELPYHIVVGMPALSPTMETGVLSEWYVEEGGPFSAGQSIAKIETDKASIDFEAQDDGYVAKILIPAGTGADIACGTPIMVTVEEEEAVAAFANYVLPETEAPAAPPAPEEPVAAAAPPAPQPVVATPPPPTAPTPAPAVEVPVPPPPVEELVAVVAPVMSTGWGQFAKLNSPLLKMLSKQQVAYIEKYGTTGQLPL